MEIFINITNKSKGESSALLCGKRIHFSIAIKTSKWQEQQKIMFIPMRNILFISINYNGGFLIHNKASLAAKYLHEKNDSILPTFNTYIYNWFAQFLQLKYH